ncbi:MAG: hypothetical protein KZQ97_14015 [Candidatus Thiodiazotropha sp. (ex Dulcina madagascariensis)]|nr:hypothetical protein [Candidatus Thiodiazotropha sp. (ex Dulcina madagascariensis)]
MANDHRSVLLPVQQTYSKENYGEVLGLSEEALLSLRMAERMSMLSEDILHAAQEGEAYETIVRKVESLHSCLADLTNCANRALFGHGFYKQDGGSSTPA